MKHPVRRKDREITDPGELDEILEKGVFGVLAMCGEEGPYAVPMNYVSRPGAVYFHCAAEGLKLDILRQNPRGCFSVVLNTDYARPDNPDRSCGWGMFYESVTVWGPVVFVESRDGRKKLRGKVRGKLLRPGPGPGHGLPPGRGGQVRKGQAPLRGRPACRGKATLL